MIAEKTYIISTDQVFRRIKDIVDLYYLSNVFEFNKKEILSALKNSERVLGNFDGLLHRKDELIHSYEKFRFEGNVNKPLFDEIYKKVICFIGDILE